LGSILVWILNFFAVKHCKTSGQVLAILGFFVVVFWLFWVFFVVVFWANFLLFKAGVVFEL